ncbi:MAG: amidohydrolase family protein [Armatimonadota bacterium]|nr:amidohydrolase family protein [Armatimonadota bacterium]
MQGLALEDIRLSEYRPRCELVLPEHRVQRARFPVIDAHCHLGRIVRAGREAAARLVEEMDACGVRAIVNLDGDRDAEVSLENSLRVLREPYPQRFILFTVLNWKRVEEGEGFGERMAADLRAAVARGAQGAKIHKSLGLRIRDPQGKLLMPDDPRLDPVFETAAELKIPVLYHIADPRAFFRPLTLENERLEQLLRHPEWHFAGPEFPPFEALMEAQESLLKRHPRTCFISAHVCSYVENLAWVSRLLDTYPNLHCDFSARFEELGRQPYSARRWFLRYPNRILFGSDFEPNAERYRVVFRFLETDDEYFPYTTGQPTKGRWHLYGVYLPDDVLRQVYAENAARLIPGV